MEENTKLDNLCSSPEDIGFEEIGLEKMNLEKIQISDQSDGLDFPNLRRDNFVVDVARLSHIMTTNELTANSNFSRSLSRKGIQQKSSERKTKSIIDYEKESKIVASASPKATLGGASMLEKPLAGPLDRAQAHHQITITTTGGGGGAESRSPAKRHSFRRSQNSWAFNPRKIFLVLATLSSMGTILLIYFTLSLNKSSGDDSAQNW